MQIIFFEMCYPMKSGMERVQVLSNLRLPRPRYPVDWDVGERSAQTQIVEWILKHDPEERPEAEDLLRSSLLCVLHIAIIVMECKLMFCSP
jgi:translation initiation factor 2-alpha kinase 4